MIIGHGDIANVLTDREDVIFFASGVSNSLEKNTECFQREINLLLSQPTNKHFVYFSTLSIYYGDSFYIRHKKYMENLIKQIFINYTIVRIGNITWGNNPNTLLNYISKKIKNNETFEIKNEYRHILTKSDFLFWVEKIPVNSQSEMNITGKKMLVKDIVYHLRNNSLLDLLD